MDDRRKRMLGVGAAAMAVVLGVWVTQHRGAATGVAAVSPTAASAPNTSGAPGQTAPLSSASRPLALGGAPESLRPQSAAAASDIPLGSNQVPQFKSDSNGHLVYDAHTRNELERLIALNDRADAQRLLQQSAAGLPASAFREATDAYYAYQNYSLAVARQFPPGQQVTSEAGALQQLDALHTLRVDQLGANVATAYFGDEEATSRRLIATMQALPANSTLQERAEQAQQGLPPAPPAPPASH